MIKFLLLIVSMILVASVYKVYSDKHEHIIEKPELKQTKENRVTETIIFPKKKEPIVTPEAKVLKKIKSTDKNENVLVTEKNSENGMITKIDDNIHNEEPPEKQVVAVNKEDSTEVIEDVLVQDNIPSKELDYMGSEYNKDTIPSKADMEKVMKMNLEAIRNDSEDISEEDIEKMMKINLELMHKNPKDITEEDMEQMGRIMNPNLESMEGHPQDVEGIEDVDKMQMSY